MSRMRSYVASKLAIAAAISVVCGGIYVASMPKTDAVFFQGVCSYYQDATYKKVVGARGTGCCGAVINWGDVTPYKKCQNIYCTDQVCPNAS